MAFIGRLFKVILTSKLETGKLNNNKNNYSYGYYVNARMLII